MTATIKIKNSSTASAVPGSGDLVQGELAVNVTDKKIYTKNASGTIVNLGTTPSITDNGNAEAIVIDSSENVGIGVTPSAWGSPINKAIEMTNGVSLAAFQTANIPSAYLTSNGYYSGSNWIYKVSSAASQYQQVSGQHIWYNAASGTAGNAITFTQAMTLDASGNLGVGTTSPGSRLDVRAAAGGIYLNSTTGTNQVALQTNNSGGDFYFGIDNSAGNNFNTGTAYAGVLWRSGSNPICFVNNSTERARIDSSGRLLVGTTSTVDSATLSIFAVGGTVIGSRVAVNGNYVLAAANSSGTVVGGVIANASTTSFPTSSDYRLKENVAPMTGALAAVAQLKPCTYTWKATGEEGQGFIAHELQAVVPDAVVGEKDAVDEDGNPKYQGIDTSFLVATLTAAIQELKAIVDAQAVEIAALKGQA